MKVYFEIGLYLENGLAKKGCKFFKRDLDSLKQEDNVLPFYILKIPSFNLKTLLGSCSATKKTGNVARTCQFINF